MSSITVPQVEFVGGSTPQETAALFNTRIVELRFNKPTFERVDSGFWITYTKEIETSRDKEKEVEHSDVYPRCSNCLYFEKAGERVKWGVCRRYGDASVNANKKACATFWKYKLGIGGDELNA